MLKFVLGMMSCFLSNGVIGVNIYILINNTVCCTFILYLYIVDFFGLAHNGNRLNMIVV